MGLLDNLLGRKGIVQHALAYGPGAGLESPNATSLAQRVVFAEYFTGEIGEVTRESALQIPAIKKARDVYVSVGASLALVEFDGETQIEQPWLTSTKTAISPWHRLGYIIDDLLFYDWSALAVTRDAAGQIMDALRIPINRWEVDTEGRILVDKKRVSAEEVVLIPGNGSGGILVAGAPTIRGARALERAWIGRAQNPVPIMELHQTTDDELEEDEIDEIVDAWALARTSPTGAVGFTDNRVELRVHGAIDTNLFEEGRNAIVLDIARLTGLPAALLDGSMSTASLTYSTQEGHRNEFLDYTLPMLLSPIEARLSLDDVSGAGRVIRFDKSSLITPTHDAITSPREDTTP